MPPDDASRPATAPPHPPARGGPPPLTLVVGSEEFLSGRALDHLIAAARAEDPETTVLRISAETLVEEPGTLEGALAPSLFGERAVIVLEGAEGIDAEYARSRVLPLLDDLPDHVSLVVVHSGAANRGKVLLEGCKGAGAAVVAVATPKPGELESFLRAQVKAEHRVLTSDGARALIEAVAVYDKGALKNLRGLAGACAQLVADTTGAIDARVVGRYFAGRAEVKGWEIADAVVEGRTAEAAAALRASLDTGTHPLLVVGALAASLRTLAKAKTAFSVPGLRSGDLARELGVPPFKVDIIRRQANPWSHRGLAIAVVAVARADVAVKGGEESHAYALERAVAEVLAARSLG